MNFISHIEINVSNLKRSVEFWSKFLSLLGWKKFDLDHSDVVGFRAPDLTNLFLVQTESAFISRKYHRKHTGLNHVAFRVGSAEEVDRFARFLKENLIPTLYHKNPKDYSSEYTTERYYAVFFEDPDRVKLEIVYCK